MLETSNKIAELEDSISKIIFNDNKSVVRFDYKTLSNKFIPKHGGKTYSFNKKQVIAYTTNHNTGETFVLKVATGDSYEEALKDILYYVESHKKEMNSYTVIWRKKGNTNTQHEKSYFYCENALEVLNKFFEGKDIAEYTIYELKLNPIA